MCSTFRAVAIVCCVCIFPAASFASRDVPKKKFMASSISAEMKKNAHAVVRFEEIEFEVKSIRSARHRVYKLITVLDAEGRDFGELSLWYDKFLQLKDVDARIFDVNGEEIRSLDSKDVNDYAASSGHSLYDDNRIRHAKIYHSSYPYTIEIEYEYEYNGYLSWPEWVPEETRAFVELSRLRVTAPSEINVRYWSKTKCDPDVHHDGGKTIYTWTAEMLPPFEYEVLGPAEQFQSVRLAPERFEIEGYRGELNSWKSLGQWYGILSQGRQSLPDRVRKDVLALVEGAVTPAEKTRRVYEHLQSTTRYISIQLGIGGWQPFDAEYVVDRRYGDCKALSNYMIAMLGAAGVKAYPALIHNSSLPPEIAPEFPINKFNHVIVCVPSVEDTMWVECTSQTIPFGHIGSANENRLALVVTPEGGVLVKTPTSMAHENMQIRKAKVTLTEYGTGTADIHTTFTGNQQDYVRRGVALATPKERDDWLRDHINIPVFKIQDADFSRAQLARSTIGFDIRLQLSRFAAQAGKRLLFQPNLMEKRKYVPPQLEKRKCPVVYSYTYVDIDSIEYKLPDGFVVEAMPKSVAVETAFAEFSSTIEQHQPDMLRYTRRLEIKALEIPAEKYNDYRKFFQHVVQSDNASVAIVRK